MNYKIETILKVLARTRRSWITRPRRRACQTERHIAWSINISAVPRVRILNWERGRLLNCDASVLSLISEEELFTIFQQQLSWNKQMVNKILNQILHIYTWTFKWSLPHQPPFPPLQCIVVENTTTKKKKRKTSILNVFK